MSEQQSPARRDVKRPQGLEGVTDARKRLEAIKREKLGEGPWELSWFSPPGEWSRCEHFMPRLVIPGGLPLYLCDDCEHYLLGLGAAAFVIPKQHIPAYSLFLMAHFLKYEGPQALAEALVRPHRRLDQEGHPSLPPIHVIDEMRAMWQRTLEYLNDYYREALEGSERMPLAEDSAELPPEVQIDAPS